MEESAPGACVQSEPVKAARPRVLCVDDEPNVLEGLARQLHRRYDVMTAASALAGLPMVNEGPGVTVVISDLRMPGMNGAAFLAKVREVAPDTVRILLTGQGDLEAAIAAVNEGSLFRFLTKPCPPELLLKSVEAAVEQHRLTTVERTLLQETVLGSIKVLSDLLSLTNPAAFGRATRAKQYVGMLGDHLGVAANDRWSLEAAAMLSQIGAVTLPPRTAEKLYHGNALTAPEQAMVDRLPIIADELLASIPRLEPVRRILAHQDTRFDGPRSPRDGLRGESIPLGARILKVVLDFDFVEAQGNVASIALGTLRGRAGWYDPRVLRAFETILCRTEQRTEVREVRLRDVRAGMVFAEDVTTSEGTLLIARGQVVSHSLFERLRNFSVHLGVKEPVRVIVPVPRGPATTTGEHGAP